ncbi:hypothetical protein B0H67DRAFT_481603 [Lasiosphaeris hirsuta]|uniref:Cellobiose dehydrogenase-like cytochrome domain-containing protein n=1 Tax=Lasiosphaeris hirsuta TaxID=260670 RepID=A0AA40B1B5_9PEZI|nr:hypothetical protein B0H67DRAFT_481603 [Lasiosphaeris hirsuta]
MGLRRHSSDCDANLAPVPAAVASTIYRDPDTGLTFAQNVGLYKSDGRGVTFRIAVPDAVDSYAPYDVVIQIVVPTEVGWAGFAWNGGMAKNPLLAVWRASNNQDVVVSSRWSNSHVSPTPYAGSQYTVFKTGTKYNSTHWQVTAKCTGCTSWTSDGGNRYLQPKAQNRVAFAYSPSKPSNPNSNTSNFPVHDVHAYWNHEFALASNANFATTVQKLQS